MCFNKIVIDRLSLYINSFPQSPSVFPASDSFHPLLAEVTQNETVDPSMTFHLPEQETPTTSPERSEQSAIEVRNRLTYSSEEDEAGSIAEPSVTSDPSPDRLRAEEPSLSQTCHTAIQESFDQLSISQCHPNQSVDFISPIDQEVELPALRLSSQTPSGDGPPTPKASLLEREPNVPNESENIWEQIVVSVRFTV